MSSEQFSGAADSITSAFSNFTASLKPLRASVSKQWVQAQQFAKERLSNADSTELPLEYRQLEDRVEHQKLVHELFLKVARNYTLQAYDYQPNVTDQLSTLVSTATTNANILAGKLSGVGSVNTNTQQEIPPSLSHAFAKAAIFSCDLIPGDEPLGTAMKKFAVAQEKVGDARIVQDKNAVLKFYTPFLQALEGRGAEAAKARRLVLASRLTYDSCRSKLKSASPSKVEAVRAEMIEAEDEFVAAVDTAMSAMKLVIESNESLKSLAELVAIQAQYHKAAYETLLELSPELDELVITSEALSPPP